MLSNPLLPRPSPEPGSERDLLADLWRGDRASFDAFYEAHFQRIYNYFWRRLGTVAQAEEATEAALTAIAQGIARGQAQRPLERWILGKVRAELLLRDRSAHGAPLSSGFDVHPPREESTPTRLREG
ncbi:MAG TPA: hypothetical protein DEP35_15650 [Deltaproteobacteria bacterium]|nr:hypothetical protein [Deltaproteobacteria bacterium]